MKKIFQIAIAGLVATLATFGFGIFSANAQTATDNCALTPADFSSLLAIQTNPNLTPAEELKQELTLRRQLLTQTITCATQDAQALQVTLASVSPTTPEGKTVQSQLSGKINEALNFYGIESAKVGDAGVSATEAIAKEMLAWRAANYVSLEGNVNNFSIWSENQALFNTAQTRLAQTAQVISFIENATTGNGALDTALDAAQSSFSAAQSENVAAGTAIGQDQPADQTLGSIQQSLQSLAATYQKFSDLNGLIQALLPTTSN